LRAQTDNDGRSIDEAERLLADIGARIRDVRVGPDASSTSSLTNPKAAS
jgi:glucose/arabinose dehydrogenase